MLCEFFLDSIIRVCLRVFRIGCIRGTDDSFCLKKCDDSMSDSEATCEQFKSRQSSCRMSFGNSRNWFNLNLFDVWMKRLESKISFSTKIKYFFICLQVIQAFKIVAEYDNQGWYSSYFLCYFLFHVSINFLKRLFSIG
jgi:hypothetical protein